MAHRPRWQPPHTRDSVLGAAMTTPTPADELRQAAATLDPSAWKSAEGTPLRLDPDAAAALGDLLVAIANTGDEALNDPGNDQHDHCDRTLCVEAAALMAARVITATGPDTDRAAVVPPPPLTEEGRLRAHVQTLEEDAERDRGLAKVGARCMREGHQGLIESGRAIVEGHRFALSVKLGLGAGATWDAIHERVRALLARPAAGERR